LNAPDKNRYAIFPGDSSRYAGEMRFSLNIMGVILRDLCHAHESVPVFTVFGAISFFFGPYFTGSGFFARGFLVDTASPGCVWRFLGVVLWIIAVIVCFVSSQAA
jgi:hypothetical protein